MMMQMYIGAVQKVVMPGQEREARLRPDVPGIHVLRAAWQGVDGRDRPGHDGSGTPSRLNLTPGHRDEIA